MDITQIYRHWRLESDTNQILWLYFDRQGSSVNTINKEVMEELDAIINSLINDTLHKGLVIASAKKSGFIAGADITIFNQLPDIDEAANILLQGQAVLNKLESLTMPTLALIDGFCLGGGLELALACRYRIAEESAKTRLGLPEVKLGIHPGWGGTVRLPRLIGAFKALNFILSGHTVNGKAAAKLGMVDVAVPKRQLIHAAQYYILQKPTPHRANLLETLSNHPLSRPILGKYLRKKLNEKISPMYYPAPFHALDNWEYVGVTGQEAYEREAKSCAKLFFSDTSQQLVRVFFLQEKLKGLAKDLSYSLKHIHVIGAGTMGGDIAAWAASQGFKVTLQDLDPRCIAPAIKRAANLFKNKFKETYLIQQAMDRLLPDVQGHGIAKADLIIEAVVEDLAIKRNIFEMIVKKAKPDAILATNTSSIPLDQIYDSERLIGIHFFNPVAKMQLVEVVKGQKTSQAVIDKTIVFVRQLDRLPLPVKSSPGFLVNRILMPYLLESVELLNEGIPATAIDQAMLQFGMPLGPIALADAVGLDICLSVAKYLSQYFHSPIPQRLTELVQSGKLGKKSGEGFYKYDKRGKKIKSEPKPYDKPLQEIADRLVLRMLNEAFACLQEGVVASSDLLDAGMIFGTGFAPFRGGPIQYAKSQGIPELYQQFILLQQARGEVPDQSKQWEGV